MAFPVTLHYTSSHSLLCLCKYYTYCALSNRARAGCGKSASIPEGSDTIGKSAKMHFIVLGCANFITETSIVKCYCSENDILTFMLRHHHRRSLCHAQKSPRLYGQFSARRTILAIYADGDREQEDQTVLQSPTVSAWGSYGLNAWIFTQS
jgi:hypothetical protein